jgi:hypothetical protein
LRIPSVTFQKFFDNVTAESIQAYHAGTVPPHITYLQQDGTINTSALSKQKVRRRSATLLLMTMVPWDYFVFVEEMQVDRIIALDKPRVSDETGIDGGRRLLLIQGISRKGDFRSISFDGETICEKQTVAGAFSLESALLEMLEKTKEARRH